MKHLVQLLGVLVASVCVATVIRVPEDYQQIQIAYNSLVSGDTIRVDNGRYCENLTLDRNITAHIIGSEINEVIIDGNHSGSCVTCSSGWVYLSNMTMLNGYAESGGGIFCTNSATMYINNLLIRDNYANVGGGARFSSDRQAVITNTMIINNTANDGTSGLSFAKWPLVDKCIIRGNRGFVGGLSVGGTNNDGYFSNCIITDNTSDAYGGVSALSCGGVGTFQNVTIMNNVSESNISINIGNSTSLVFVNSIIELTDSTKVNIFPFQCCTYVHFRYCNLLGSESNIVRRINYNQYYVANCMNINPQFTGQSHYDYSLSRTSPCVDAGDPSIPFDQDGSRSDIGSKGLGEFLLMGDIDPFIVEPGFPRSQSLSLIASSSQVTIDSIVVATEDFAIFDRVFLLSQDYGIDSTFIEFNPFNFGLTLDTLHIYANTIYSNTDDPRHHIVPLVGEAGSIPGPVTDLAIQILPDQSAQLTWSPVSQTIYGNPVVPDYYLIYYSEDNPEQDHYFYLTATPGTDFTHFLVARFAPQMFYRIVAYKGINPSLLGVESGMSWTDVQRRLAREDR